MKTYKLMYKFGAWISAITLIAESDKEAIFDADLEYYFPTDEFTLRDGSHDLRNWIYEVALFQGNRLIKRYK